MGLCVPADDLRRHLDDNRVSRVADKFVKHHGSNSRALDIREHRPSRTGKADGILVAVLEAEEDHSNARLVGLVEMAHDGSVKVVARHELNHAPHKTPLRHALGHLEQSRVGSLRLSHGENRMPIKRAANRKPQLVALEAVTKSAHRLSEWLDIVHTRFHRSGIHHGLSLHLASECAKNCNV